VFGCRSLIFLVKSQDVLYKHQHDLINESQRTILAGVSHRGNHSLACKIKQLLIQISSGARPRAWLSASVSVTCNFIFTLIDAWTNTTQRSTPAGPNKIASSHRKSKSTRVAQSITNSQITQPHAGAQVQQLHAEYIIQIWTSRWCAAPIQPNLPSPSTKPQLFPGIPSLWAGLSASILRQGTYSTARFGLHNYLSSQLLQRSGRDRLPTSWNIACAGVSGGIAGLIGNPTEVVLVRMCADGAKPVESRFRYSNPLVGLWRVWREEGIKAFSRGIGPNVTRSVLMSKYY
jgi:hypothetical protein